MSDNIMEFTRPPSGPSVDDVTVHFEGFDSDEPRERQEQALFWRTTYGDPVALYCELCPPPLPTGQDSMAAFRDAMAKDAKEHGVHLVETEARVFDGFQGLGYVCGFTDEQNSRGVHYFGDLSIPFRDHYYHVRITCPERGMTGVRETASLMDTMAELRDGGSDDPMKDAQEQATHAYYDTRYDEALPEHPLSRVRWLMRMVGDSLAVSDRVSSYPAFAWPPDLSLP